MQEALITELSKIAALRVISRTSTLRYRQIDQRFKRFSDVARELNVDGVIEGSALREGDLVRITVVLFDRTGSIVWVQTFDREMRSVLAMHSEVAREIADQIQITLTPVDQGRLAGARVVNPKAYELYLLGRHHWNQRTLQRYRQAVESFLEAIEQDSTYAPAYSALADAYMWLGEQGGLPQKEAGALAAAALQKALARGGRTLADAHVSDGLWKLRFEWNWPAAERAFQRSIELNPGSAAAHQMYGRSLSIAGRFDDALRELERARELDPLSVPTNAYLGQAYLHARQYDRAAEQFQKTLQIDPNHVLPHHNLGELYLAEGRWAEAVRELEQSVAGSAEPSSHYLAMLACAYARANRKQDAVNILNHLMRRSTQGLVSAFDMASLNTALSDNERALAWLEKGFAQRDYWLVELEAWPWFESLRSDPRFQNLLRRMPFPD